MGGEIPTQQLLDKLSRQDEIMAMMIPLLREIRDKPAPQQTTPAELIEMRDILKTQHDIDREVFTLTYPRDGTRLTIAAGTTTFDFNAGTIAAPGVDIVSMGNSLMLQRKEFMRALTINADQDIILKIGGSDKIPVRDGMFPRFPYKQFTTVEVTVTQSTKILISASTSSAAIIQMEGEVGPNTADFTGTVYENEHTMIADTAYRFETSELLLRDVIVRVSTFDALVGDSANQRYPKAAGDAFGFTKVDLSKLYIKNAGAGSNTKINILGTKVL